MFAFEKLVVYKKAVMAHQLVYRFLKKDTSLPQYIKNQLGRASLSVQLNIAEGSGKFANKDRRNFYIIARASVFESVALLDFLAEENELPNELRNELHQFYSEISAMLYTIIRKYGHQT